MEYAYHQQQPLQDPNTSLHHHHGMEHMHPEAPAPGVYAQYQYPYESIPPPMPHPQYLQQHPQHPQHPQHLQPQHTGEHAPHGHMAYPSPSRIRARRRSANERPSILDVSIDDPYNADGRASPGDAPPPPKSQLRARNADDEEARKARKREMGRERQRRKRLRDKQKRDAAKTGGYECTTQPLDLVRAGSRSSIVSSSSYEGIPSSASSTYSALPPMSMNIPNPYGGGNLSDAPSPAQSLSPTMGGFASDDSSWQEHTAVFGNLNLSGDNTVRAKPRTATGSQSRRQSEAGEFYPFGMTPAKRRKSDAAEDERPGQQMGLGVTVGPPEGEAAWGQRPNPPRRTASVPEGVNLDPSSLSGASDRSATPPPVPDVNPGFAPQVSAPKPSQDGLFFASTVVLALSDNEWAASLQQKLGMTKGDLERMTPEFASAFDRWRITRGLSQVNLSGEGVQASSPPRASPRPSTFNTPSSRLGQDVAADSPAGSNASSSIPQNMRMGAGARAPETPHSRMASTSSSTTTTSPAHPSLQTPGSAGIYQGHEYPGSGWPGNPVPRMYDMAGGGGGAGGEWRGPMPPHAQSSPMTGGKPEHGGGAGGGMMHIPPPPIHPPPHAPAPALQSPVTVQPYVASEYQARMRFQPGGVPVYYDPQFPMEPHA